MSKSKLYMPIRYVMPYLFLTYLIFCISDLSASVENIWLLTGFVSMAYISLFVGYVFGVEYASQRLVWITEIESKRLRNVNFLLIVGCVYLVVWGINQLVNFGAEDVSSVIRSLNDPGAAYAAKFDIYTDFESTQKVSRIGQVLVLLGVVFVMVMPAMSAYWRHLSSKLKMFCIFSVVIYAVSFLYIGTQKGLGDLFLLLFSGWIVVRVRHADMNVSGRKIKNYLLLIFLIIVGLVSLSFIQSSRAIQFGLTSTMMVNNISDNWLANIFGESFALGFYSIIGYPAHGYLGLSHNLSIDFIFSYGAGLFQAFESYRFQYLGGENNLLLTYPYRTELTTGWPAGMYWSTAFPWIASDLTFIGVFPLMFLVGMLFARIWINCLRKMDVVSLAILGQIFVFVAFLPANNQVFISRQGLLSVTVLILIVVFRKLSHISRRSNNAI